MVKICIIVLIGLPGAGKTTFCLNLLKNNLNYNFIHICYDEIFEFKKESNETTYKTERKRVIQKVERMIGEIEKECKDDIPSVILIDDNNYYAGMRYEFYKVCKARELCFGQIYFEIDVKLALNRNNMRDKSAIPLFVIEQMNKRLERSSPKNKWEQNTMTINDDPEAVDNFISLIETCFLNPLKSKSTHEKDSEQIKINPLHEVDLCLRKRIKQILKNSGESINENAKILNEKRKCILADIRNKNDKSLDVESICQGLNL